MIQTQGNGEKPHFGPDLGRLGSNLGCKNYFLSKNLASSVTRYHGHLSSCTISEKTNDPILRKFSDDGWMDGRTDRRAKVASQDAVGLTSSVQKTWEAQNREKIKTLNSIKF